MQRRRGGVCRNKESNARQRGGNYNSGKTKYSRNNCGNEEDGAGKIVHMLVIEITDDIKERTECNSKSKTRGMGLERKDVRRK